MHQTIAAVSGSTCSADSRMADTSPSLKARPSRPFKFGRDTPSAGFALIAPSATASLRIARWEYQDQTGDLRPCERTAHHHRTDFPGRRLKCVRSCLARSIADRLRLV